MVEKKEKIPISIGKIRMSYLNYADMSFAQGNLDHCKRQLDNFIGTIPEGSKAAKQIQEEFDRIYDYKDDMEQAAEKEYRDLGFLERVDYETTVSQELNVNVIQFLKSTCWSIGFEHGLFYE